MTQTESVRSVPPMVSVRGVAVRNEVDAPVKLKAPATVQAGGDGGGGDGGGGDGGGGDGGGVGGIGGSGGGEGGRGGSGATFPASCLGQQIPDDAHDRSRL